MISIRASLLALACALPVVCMAQWQWIDKDGRKVFSDQAPPPELPAKNILKQPSGPRGKGISLVPEAASSAAAAPAAPALKLSGKDKDLEDKRKFAESAAAEKKRQQDEESMKGRAENCSRARQAKATLDSGVRVQRVNEKGEREPMDDAQRTAESKRLDTVISSECKG